MDSRCCFNECTNEAIPNSTKCAFHRHRSACTVEGCTNIVYARQLCVRHGGKHQCAQENCTANARTGGFCSRHAKLQIKRLCSEDNCRNIAHAKGKCVRHGGGRKCQFNGCETLARKGGFCHRHKYFEQSFKQPQNENDQSSLPWLESHESIDNMILDCLLTSTAHDAFMATQIDFDELLFC